MRNPERAGLVADWREWNFLGALLPGYPRLHPRDADFWPRMWKAYNSMRDPETL